MSEFRYRVVVVDHEFESGVGAYQTDDRCGAILFAEGAFESGDYLHDTQKENVEKRLIALVLDTEQRTVIYWETDERADNYTPPRIECQ